MKVFLKKILIWIVPLLLLLAALGSFADGNADDNYQKFTRQGDNLILGDSRAAQAIRPDVLEKKFPGRTFDNFALNITQSSYGQVYLKALKRKLKPGTRDGIFILAVDPWSLCIDKRITDTLQLPDMKSPLNDICNYSIKPNYEYLVKHYGQSWFYIFRDRAKGKQSRSSTYLHKDGWLEVNVNMDKDTLNTRSQKKVKDYLEYERVLNLSSYRMNALKDIIKHLKQKGQVYIVRVPGAPPIMEIEHRKFPGFNEQMQQMANDEKASYIDLSKNPESYIFTDGNHMYKESGKVFTSQIADSIHVFSGK